MLRESIFTKVPDVLIVDDQPANLKVLSEILKSMGYKIRPALSGKTALSAAEHDPPDLILLDIMMPEMDGFEVCRQLKEHATLRHIPVIFISALDDIHDKIKGFQAGGVDYITKPFQTEEVLARVSTHLRLEQYTHHLEELVDEKVREIYNSQMATILAVSKLAESRDDATGQHIERTQIFCQLMAQQLYKEKRFPGEITEAFIDTIFHASPLHDIGKVGIMDSILLKPGRLTEEEFEIMKTHVLIGADTLETVQSRYPQNIFIGMGIDLARSHHERWDGSGYPDGLKGNDIPLSARIMALADVYDALRYKRPYKEAIPQERTIEILLEGSGSHFDPAVIAAFLACEEAFAEVCRNMPEKKHVTHE